MRNFFVDDLGSVRNGWKILGYLLLTVGLGFFLGALSRLIPKSLPGWAIPGQWFGASAALGAAWICLKAEAAPLSSIGFLFDRRFLRDLTLGTLGGIALICLTALVVFIEGGFHLVRSPGLGIPALLQGAWLYLAVACFEEILFRGYAFQRTTRGLGFTWAQWLFAVFFAFAHWSNPGMHGATKIWATLNISLAAVLLAFCWRRTGSLALPIGVHLGWNWSQGNLLGFGVSGTTNAGWWTPVFHGRPEWLTGGGFGLEASLACTLVCGAAIVALWRWKGTANAVA